MTDVSAIVVNHDRKELLRGCLESLRRALGDTGAQSEILVADNASRDGSRELVRARFPEARLLELPTNRGFGAGVNQALQRASGEWVLVLNNDASVAPEAVGELLAAGRRDPAVWAVAAQLRFVGRTGTINSTGLVVDRLGVAADRDLGRRSDHAREPVEIFGPSAACALYRREALEQLGGFDERFFVYLEDVDLAWRARMHGWRSLYAPAAVAYHHHSATGSHGSPLKYYWVGRNRVRLLAKNADVALLRRYGAAMVAYDLAYVAYAAVADRTLAPARGRLAGLREWRELRREQREGRRPVALSPPHGIRAALRRRRAWDRTGR